jgi:hypothetical protein
MKYFATGVLAVIFFAGVAAGFFYITKEKNKITALSVKNTEAPADDVDLVPLKLNGIEGIQKSIDSAGGSISVSDKNKNQYTLIIPAGALDSTTTIQLVPVKQDASVRSLDFGIVVGPAKLSFTKPVTLTVDHTKSSAGAAVYNYSPEKKQLIPQAVNRLTESDSVVPIRIASGGAYLVSFNSTRREALSRLALSKTTTETLSILEAASFLLASGKQLSQDEKKITRNAMETVLTDPLSAPPELFSVLALESFFEQRNTTFLPEFYLTKACSDDSNYSSDEYLAAAAIASLNQLQSLKSVCEIKARAALAAQLQPEDGESYAKGVVWNEQPTAVEIAYALHLLNKTAPQSTLSARLLEMQKQKFTEKTIEAPSIYDFTNPPVESTPIEGYDWALIGQSLIKAVFNIETPTKENIKPLEEKIRVAIEDNQIFGQAFCSFYDSLDMRKPECLPYSSAIETSTSKLIGL